MGPAILLMGPTGAGKTDAAIEIAARLPVEIISVDSAMVYRGLDIGSAKPPPDVLARCPHHLVDICDPAERYSVGEFLRDVGPLMQAIRARGRWPLLVGGTMLYFRALQSGMAQLPSADPVVRARICADAEVLGWTALHARLQLIDPRAAARIAMQDSQRIQRALEVYELTGRPISDWQQEALKTARPADYLRLVLAPPEKSALDARLSARFDLMLANGFLDEVRSLHARGDLTDDLPALRSVGYRQLWQHLAGHCDFSTARELAIVATRQLAKRQYTWLRAEPEAVWVSPMQAHASDKLCEFIGEWAARHKVI
jgi:tRNA dimethylallyltransferase